MKIGIIGVGVVGKAIKNGFENTHEIFLHDPKLGTELRNVTDNTDFLTLQSLLLVIRKLVNVI